MNCIQIRQTMFSSASGTSPRNSIFEERLQLMYAKGTRYFEDTPVPDATVDDIDLDFVER